MGRLHVQLFVAPYDENPRPVLCIVGLKSPMWMSYYSGVVAYLV